MPETTYDVIVVGSGGAGLAAALAASVDGAKVLVLEKEIFPRFHIGESLLPANHALFREMGLLPKLEAAGFLRKLGAYFELSNGSVGNRVVFGEGRFNREPEAIHVERSRFDHVLL